MKAVLQGDARADHDRGKAAMAWVADDRLAQCFREHGCLWSETEFEGYISKLQEEKQVNQEDLFQLPQSGALVRYGIMRCVQHSVHRP